MEERKLRVAITHGDTNGVGYELILKTFDDPTMMELCTPIIYGSPKVATYHRKALNIQTQFSIISSADDAKENRLNLLATFDDEIKVEMGQSSDEATEAARKALKRAMVDVQQGVADVLVMAPDNLPDFLSKEPELLRIRIADDLRVALITNLLAFKDVPEAITKQKIVEKGKIMHTCLRRDLRISNPRIAVLALNPPTGNEADPWGEEEKEVIIPAIEELEQAGIQVHDVIVKVDDTEVKDNSTLVQAIAKADPGDVMTFTVYRQGQEIQIDVEIGSKTEDALKDEGDEAESSDAREWQQDIAGWSGNPFEDFFNFGYFGH